MAENAKPQRKYDRSYNGNVVSISQDDDVVVQYDVTSIHGAASISGSALKGLSRYTADIIVGVGMNALKAEGGTKESAAEKMAETLKAFQDGTFAFRAASGSGEDLSDEDTIVVIADALVAMGKAPDKESALKIVNAVYAVTKKNAKGYDLRPDFNELKRIPAIKEAITKAANVDSGTKVDSVLARFKTA